jgi:hypothetical protein
MIIVKATKDSEAGVLPDETSMARMAQYHEELAKAGALLDASGLQASSKGWKVKYSGEKRTVIDGPFTESKELIAGYWLWQVRDMDEAIEWIKRAPFDGGTQIELRPVFEEDGFGDEFTPELKEQERRLRAQIEEQQS